MILRRTPHRKDLDAGISSKMNHKMAWLFGVHEWMILGDGGTWFVKYILQDI
jgi:hypothetical protein